MTDNELAEITEPDAIKTALEARVKALAKARHVESMAKLDKTAAEHRLIDTEEWRILQGLKDVLKLRKADASDIYDSVAILAIDLFLELGEKKIVDDVQVIEKKGFDITDDAAALAWCEDNLPIAVIKTVNEDLVEAALKSIPEGQRPDFALIDTQPAVRVASDLSSWLDDEDEDDADDS